LEFNPSYEYTQKIQQKYAPFSSSSAGLPGGVCFHILQEIHLCQGFEALLNGGMPPASVKFGALGSSGWRSPWWASRGFARNEQHNAAKVGHGDNARLNHCKKMSHSSNWVK